MSVYILCDMVLKRKWGTPLYVERLTWENWYLGYVVVMVTDSTTGANICAKIFSTVESHARVFSFCRLKLFSKQKPESMKFIMYDAIWGEHNLIFMLAFNTNYEMILTRIRIILWIAINILFRRKVHIVCWPFSTRHREINLFIFYHFCRTGMGKTDGKRCRKKDIFQLDKSSLAHNFTLPKFRKSRNLVDVRANRDLWHKKCVMRDCEKCIWKMWFI